MNEKEDESTGSLPANRLLFFVGDTDDNLLAGSDFVADLNRVAAEERAGARGLDELIANLQLPIRLVVRQDQFDGRGDRVGIAVGMVPSHIKGPIGCTFAFLP